MPNVDNLPLPLIEAIGCDDTARLRIVNQTLINESYCLTSYHERFLVKRFLADKSTGRSRKLLFAIQKQIAKHGLAPEPLFLCEESGYYAEKWVTPSLTPLNVLSDEARMKKLADALVAIHKLPITTARLDLTEQWDHYIQAAKIDASDLKLKRTKELVFLSASSINSTQDLVFCHNDLAMNHVIDYERLMIIDWEYCSTGNRYFDIASTFAINRLSAAQRSILLSHYASAFGLTEEQVQAGVFRHEPLVTLTYQLWYAAITEHVKHVQ